MMTTNEKHRFLGWLVHLRRLTSNLNSADPFVFSTSGIYDDVLKKLDQEIIKVGTELGLKDVDPKTL